MMKQVLRLFSALAVVVGLSLLLMPTAEAGGCGGGWKCWGPVVGYWPMPAAPGYVASGCGGCVNVVQYYARGGYSPCYGYWRKSCWYDAYGARYCASPCYGCY